MIIVKILWYKDSPFSKWDRFTWGGGREVTINIGDHPDNCDFHNCDDPDNRDFHNCDDPDYCDFHNCSDRNYFDFQNGDDSDHYEHI